MLATTWCRSREGLQTPSAGLQFGVHLWVFKLCLAPAVLWRHGFGQHHLCWQTLELHCLYGGKDRPLWTLWFHSREAFGGNSGLVNRPSLWLRWWKHHCWQIGGLWWGLCFSPTVQSTWLSGSRSYYIWLEDAWVSNINWRWLIKSKRKYLYTSTAVRCIQNIPKNQLLKPCRLTEALVCQLYQQTESIIQSHFRQCISILLQKGNVGLLTSRIPSYPEGHVDTNPDFKVPVPRSSPNWRFLPTY